MLRKFYIADINHPSFSDTLAEYKRARQIARVIAWALPGHLCVEVIARGKFEKKHLSALPYEEAQFYPYVEWVYTEALILGYISARLSRA